MDGKLHPALTVTNIRISVPIVLEMEGGQYMSWAELFKVHCRAFQVMDHIDPKSEAPDQSSSSTATSPALWKCLDAIVLQWLYGSISNDLLHTILKPNQTASQAWIALENIFQDNQSSRAVYLEHQFVTTKLDNHPNISSYCQKLKMLADQLANVDAPVSNQRLVLQLIAGLNESFENVAMLIQQTTPLPEFYEARSKLILEENRKNHLAAASASHPQPTALHTAGSSFTNTSQQQPSDSSGHHQPSRGQGRGRGNRGRGRSSQSRGRGTAPNSSTQPTGPRPAATCPAYPPWTYPGFSAWAYPPCPYPAQPYGPPRPPPGPFHGQGILGPRPQAYAASDFGYTPTELDTAFHAMTLQQPDPLYYMDTGASSTVQQSAGPSDADSYSQVQQHGCNNLQRDDADCLKYAMVYMPNLEVLNLSENPLQDEGIRILAPYLVEKSRRETPLAELYLENCEISCHGASQLLEMLAALTVPLKTLSIGDNHLTSKFGVSLGKFLHSGIQTLDIKGIGLGPAGFSDAQEEISQVSSIVRLNISDNGGGVKSADFLSKVILHAPKLISVDASDNWIPIESLPAVCSFMEAGKGKLEQLNLRQNPLCNKPGIASLLAEFQVNGKPDILLSSPVASLYDNDP